MLTVTENAATAIRDITSQDVVPDGSGLRISADEGGTALTLSLVAKPFDGDQVVSSAGARLFLDRLAAQLLDDKELDVTVDPSGDVQFAVGDQFDYGVSEDF
ncbi:MAG TPA: adhesin [Micromonosporaceae bacterium]